MTPLNASKRRRKSGLELNKAEVIALVLENKSDAEIAGVFKVNRTSVRRFRERHDDEIAPLKAEVEERVKSFAISDIVERSRHRNERWLAGHDVITQRAKDMADEVAGGGTGLLTRDYKGGGEGGFVPVYKVDTGLLAALLALERAEAEERDQMPRNGVTLNDNRTQVLIRQVIGFDPAELG